MVRPRLSLGDVLHVGDFAERPPDHGYRWVLNWGVIEYSEDVGDTMMVAYQRFRVWLGRRSGRTLTLWSGRRHNARVRCDCHDEWLPVANLLPEKERWLT